ncbi:unnamed protein product [Porites evermanni]|uniref:Caspase-8 n=1 Tax=Porites evermanni TaxID=104178 RepID=A0ABN8MH13_9CNID|nr:unnamed protein product [Porites evermanni]
MATYEQEDTVRVRTLVSSLTMDVLEKLGMKLNPRHPMKDFRYLAGKMNYNYEMVRNFALQRNPTVALLHDWFMSHTKNGEAKTVSHLIELLKNMKRDDVVEILQPLEFTEIPQNRPVNNLSNPHVPYDLSTAFYGPPGQRNIFGDYSKGDLKETRPPQENEYLHCNNLSGSRLYNNYEGDERYWREVTFNTQQNMFYDLGSPLAAEPRPQVRHPATVLQNGSSQGEVSYSELQTMQRPPPNTIPQSPPGSHYGDVNVELPPVYRQHNFNPPGPSRLPPSPPRPVVSDKVALVIGNQNYECQMLQGLAYPEKDAYDVAFALQRLEFKVVSLVNLSLSEMRIAVLSFTRMLGRGVYGVLYYAGHGFDDGGESFLLPVDADLKYDREHSLRAQEILQTMQTCNTELNLLIIDSCRIRLPNNGGSVQYCKRGARGNNIFAYSCCSQHEAYEAPGKRNGLYAFHLLNHIRRNERIELILMDVARDVTRESTRSLIQRPCHESDAVADCRLTDPIIPTVRPIEFNERIQLWNEAHFLPGDIRPIERDGITITFNYRPVFSNVLDIAITARNSNPVTLHQVVMGLDVPTPVMTHLRYVAGEVLDPYMGTITQVVQLNRLQKLEDPLVAKFKIYYDNGNETRDFEETVCLGCPLISSVFARWDWWITCGQIPQGKCTQV